MRRAILAVSLLACGAGVAVRAESPARLGTARAHAAEVTALITETFADATALDRASLRWRLADYAALPPGAAARSESLTEAARRILASGTTTKRTPDETLARLDELADAIFPAADGAEIAARAAQAAVPERELTELRASGHVARFHARRIVAAMHYNLFLRGQRLAELVAATYAEKNAVETWRQLTTLPAPSDIAEARRAELKKLEASLKDLEDQCCPPDENILKEKVWQPVRPARAAQP